MVTCMPGRLRALLILLLLTLLAGCSEEAPVREESFVFGTRVEVLTLGTPAPQAHAAIAEVLREFDRLHRTYHAWQPSPLTDLNQALARGEAAPASAEMRWLIERARDYAQRSDELFNPAIGGMIELWGFHHDTYEAHIPDEKAIAALVAKAPRMSDVSVAGDTVRSTNRAVALDFGGIAKGWALDRAAAILRARGIHSALINIGGNVMAVGQKKNGPWMVGIQSPRGGGTLATLALYDGEAIGTSGDYQRYFEVSGQRFCHLIDPRDGHPVRHTEAVSVLIPPGEDAGLRSDVTSKPLFISGEGWRAMARRMGVEHALRVDANGHIQLTAAMRARLRWSEDAGPAEVVE